MHARPTDAQADREQRLADALDRLAESQRNGMPVDVQAEIAAEPDLADELGELWAAVQLADMMGTHPDSASVCSPQLAAQPALQLPCTFGDYELLEEIGRGGMGIVYRAQQISLDRAVAVKMILPGKLASSVDLSRFRAEAAAAGRLNHPGIVPVYEWGERDGYAYFSMQYVAGPTLTQRLVDGPLPPHTAARLLLEVSRAIHEAHRGGVLHRDLKPSNILIDEEGAPHVTDFGLAKRVESHESLTRTGAILGTPSYLAPEQAAGNRGDLGPATDVYSLGAVLYQMLTGRPPFQAASPLDTIMLVLEQDPPLPRVLNPRADRDLELIALRCLQKPAELRYSTAAALADDLAAYLAGEPISARSGRFSAVIANWFRETHHVNVLENWGLLWMWHAAILLALCLLTNFLQLRGVASPLSYAVLWGGGLAVWAPIFWALRRRSGPVTFVERQVAHVWGGSVICSVGLFGIEGLLGLPVLTLSPVLGLFSGMVFMVKAGILSGEFYFHAIALFATAAAMAVLQRYQINFGITLFGVVSALTFVVPGWKYYRRRKRTVDDNAPLHRITPS